MQLNDPELVQAAGAAGMVVIWVRYGYNHGENIEQAGADALVDPLTDLSEMI
jgi:phosphoglycolate phosphatase